MKSATIYKVGDKFYLIHSDVKTASGFWIAHKPFFNIPQNSSENIISASIKDALGHDDNIRTPDPQDWSMFNREFLVQSGIKTSSILYKNTTKNIAVAVQDDLIVFIPTRHAEKPDRGFVHKSQEEAISVSYSASPDDIVAAMRLAFSRCD